MVLFKFLAVSLILTETFELLYALYYLKVTKSRISSLTFIVILLTNLITNPPVVLTYFLCNNPGIVFSGLLFQVVLEIPVFIIEAFILSLASRKAALDIRKPAVLGVSMNMFSWGMGVILSLM